VDVGRGQHFSGVPALRCLDGARYRVAPSRHALREAPQWLVAESGLTQNL
jgi:hypothetical protein